MRWLAVALLAPLNVPDRLTIAFLLPTAAATAILHPSPVLHVACFLLQAAAIVTIAQLARRGGVARLLHEFLPILIVFMLFQSLGPVIAQSNPHRFDTELARLDSRWFGALAEGWLGLLGRPAWLTDVASVAYVSFYFFPVVVALVLHQRRRSEFEAFAAVILATFLASYVGYFLWPALGPRVPAELEAERLGGGTVSVFVRDFMRVVEGNQLDAFPSGHAAVAVATAVFGWRALPRARVLLALELSAILFSTVYLSLHYVIDIVAGVALGLAVPPLVLRLIQALSNGRTTPGELQLTPSRAGARDRPRDDA